MVDVSVDIDVLIPSILILILSIASFQVEKLDRGSSPRTSLVCDPTYIVGRMTLVVRVRLGEIMSGCLSSDEVGLYVYPDIISPNLT